MSKKYEMRFNINRNLKVDKHKFRLNLLDKKFKSRLIVLTTLMAGT